MSLVQGAVAAETVSVLLIEDNAGFAYFVQDILLRQEAGRFRLEHAADLAAGLAALERDRPDIVLLDLGLPDSGGLASFRRVNAAAPETPVLILTVLEDDDLTLRALEHGAQDYLIKGRVDRTLLVRAVDYAIARARAEETVRSLSQRLLQIQDEERRRLARALHDTTAQNLAALTMNLSAMGARLPADHDDAVVRLLRDSLSLAETCSRELRTLSYLLHPPLLDELGLAGAVRDYADGFSERSGIRVDLEVSQDLGRLQPQVETGLFRVLQECLTNVHRHSGSRTASVKLVREDSEIVLAVSDTGRGFSGLGGSDGTPAAMGVGIPGMRARIRELGGRIEIRSGATGTAVTARLPLAAEGSDARSAHTGRG